MLTLNLKSLMGSSTDLALGVFSNGHWFESPQDHLPKVKPCAYHSTRASRVLRVSLELVKVRVVRYYYPTLEIVGVSIVIKTETHC